MVLGLCSAMRLCAGAAATTIHWNEWSAHTFTEAAGAHKFVLLEIGSTWCQACRVMMTESYADESVRVLVNDHYYAVHVDRSEFPDLNNRYPGYDQPTVVIFNTDGSEIVRLGGFRTAVRMADLLQAVIDDPSPGPSAAADSAPDNTGSPVFSGAVVEALQKAASAQAATPQQFSAFAAYYLDAALLEYEAATRAVGDPLSRSTQGTLEATQRLLDPAWGGIYQSLVLPRRSAQNLQQVSYERYQVGRTLDDTSNSWNEAHFEKPLMVQAQAIKLFARAATLQGRSGDLAVARGIEAYVRNFLTSPEGAFYAGQAGEVRGEIAVESYYALDDAGRRRYGVPDVDRHIYARENGWMIDALCALYASGGDPAVLERAERAARWVIQHRAVAGGGYSHGESLLTGPYLGDSLALGEALLSLYRVTGDSTWLQRSRAAVQFISEHFAGAGEAGFATAVSAPTPAYRAQPDPLENAQLASLAHLLYQCSGDQHDEAIAIQALRYLSRPGVATSASAAAVLLAHIQFTHATNLGCSNSFRARPVK